jgi:hypothetical protein
VVAPAEKSAISIPEKIGSFGVRNDDLASQEYDLAAGRTTLREEAYRLERELALDENLPHGPADHPGSADYASAAMR